MDYENNHYVPQFYLKRFSNNSKSIGMAEISSQKMVKNASIEKIASKKYLYGKNNKIEEILGQFEGIWAQTIKNIIDLGSISQTEDIYENILSFIAVSDARTLKIADLYDEFADATVQSISAVRKGAGKDDFNFQGKIGYEIPNLIPLQGILTVCNVISDLKLDLIINNTNRGFITSDDPLVKYNQLFVTRQYRRNYGFGHVGTQVFIPISPQYCLCLYDDIVYDSKRSENNKILINSTSEVVELNKLFLLNAYRQIYYNNKEHSGCIKSLLRYYKKDDSNQNDVIVLGGGSKKLIGMGSTGVRAKIKLPFFNISCPFLTIPFPSHEAGPLRPNAIKYTQHKQYEAESL